MEIFYWVGVFIVVAAPAYAVAQYFLLSARKRKVSKKLETVIVGLSKEFWSDGLSREQKLEEALNRYGRIFKCEESSLSPEKELWKIADTGRDIPNWLRRK